MVFTKMILDMSDFRKIILKHNFKDMKLKESELILITIKNITYTRDIYIKLYEVSSYC